MNIKAKYLIDQVLEGLDPQVDRPTTDESDSLNKTFAQDLKDMMTVWDKLRAKWIKEFGSDKGFQEWFTKQFLSMKK